MSKQSDKPILVHYFVGDIHAPIEAMNKYVEMDALIVNRLHKYMKDETAKSHLYCLLRKLGLKSPPEVYKTIIIDSIGGTNE